MSLNLYKFHYHLNRKCDQKLIIFLHGFMGDRNEFNSTIALLAQDYSYLTIDLPGHGKTQVLGDNEYYNIPNTAEGIINLLDDLQIYNCYLIGYSMGGRLALYLALYYPERFSQVVLESASPGLVSQAERDERIQQDGRIARKLARISTKEEFIAFLSNWYSQGIFGNIKHHPEFEQLIVMRSHNNPQELAKSLLFMGTGCQPSLWRKLRENQIPVLLLAGEYDKKFISINQQMVNICSFCQLKVILNTAHNTHLENTYEFVQNIRKFI
ncbi:2-succinyl-6-hydroxy-2,4-cyclohexadiene-1-carboxylate synthase [Brunnivagina elsteri]|uniref:Putative 2-succinyl-6-hydroxy-2,4-cyclohexadiene-1-carboxylate synthase n=1 Tax=Brunnivagina elsteri CCALA 953 TaxID=987040 RepID=A0A2A2TE74_9CYAN|nr:2-succinyl-6-hydroxy-2,4-cyclohexadiene-1-carboxylate synthase [Calothrix elsteri]PAX52097.1 2-succinyl-6-hydroxy-2,4-cyclohexadiene-1-carboxylate synthase [Calothrix elsteri CCALA 953]